MEASKKEHQLDNKSIYHWEIFRKDKENNGEKSRIDSKLKMSKYWIYLVLRLNILIIFSYFWKIKQSLWIFTDYKKLIL